MAQANGLTQLKDPFYGFPCLLAIRDLQRTVKATMGTPLNTRKVARLLALDPLALIRGLRVANAPVQSPDAPVGTIRHCIKSLGGAACARLFRVPALDSAGTERIRRLWLHSLATALAAADLAEATGDYEPEKAYTAGLLHDLQSLLNCIMTIQGEDRKNHSVSDVLSGWRLPDHIVETVTWFEKRHTDEELLGAVPKLVIAAEQMAEISGFVHHERSTGEQQILSELFPSEASPARNLPDMVRKALEPAGLDAERVISPAPDCLPRAKDRIPLDGKPLDYNLAGACNTMIEFSRGEGLTTHAAALVTALRKHLDFDRVYFFKWSGPGRMVHFRHANDTTPHPHTAAEVEPSRWEMAFLGRLVGQARAGLLERPPEGPTAILDLLGTDSALVSPVIARSNNQGFIIADLGLRGRPVGRERLPDLRAVCGLAALSIENQLIERVASRHGHAATIDPMTGVFNRRAGLARLGRLLEEESSLGSRSTLVMLDVDKFKSINDTYGHQSGDSVLKVIAKIVLSNFDDIGTVSRIGGEEFLVIIPDHQPQQVLHLVEITRQEVEQHDYRKAGLEDGTVTVSMGVTATREEDRSVDRLMHRVDQALYASKKLGRNRFCVDLGDQD